MRESEVEKYLCDRVKALGGEVRKVKWINRRNAPDRRVSLPFTALVASPFAYWVEVKAPGEGLRPGQAREFARLRARGETIYVVDSLGAVDALLPQR